MSDTVILGIAFFVFCTIIVVVLAVVVTRDQGGTQ